MRKIATTLAIAVLLVIGWMASDDDTTPTTDPADEPVAATTPTSAPDQPDEGSNGDTATTAEPVTPEPTSQDREEVEADTPTPGSEPSGSADSDNGGQSSPSALSEQIAALPVADDDRTGYDRDDFGDYDRDALLDASLHDHGCYLSLANDQCYDDASEVHVDQNVSATDTLRLA